MRSSRSGKNRWRENAVGSSWDDFSWSSPLSPAVSSGACRIDTYDAADSATMSLISLSSSSAPFLTESSLSAASCVFFVSRVPHRRAGSRGSRGSRGNNLAEGIKDLVKVEENLPFGNLGYVVHALAGVVSNARILVGEAGKDGWHDFFQVSSYIL